MARLAGLIEVGVGPSTKGFWSKFRADVSKNPPRIDVKVNPDLTRLRAEIAAERKRQESRAIHIPVAIDKKSEARTQQSLKRIEHTWKQSAMSRAIRINLMVAGASSMPSLIQGLMSLTTAVTNLGRAALVLPGVFSGIGAAIGTVATGVQGLSDVFKEAGNSAENAAQKSRLYQQATRDLERAQRDVIKALKDANREIEDQRDKLTQNQLSVEQAQLNLQKANQKLSKGGFESVTDWRQALLDQKQAQVDLNDVLKRSKRDIQDYYDGAKKGATQSETFKDSLDKLSTAIEDFTKKQQEASGFSEKFLQAFEKLSPSAKDFATQVLALKGAWTQLQNSVQDKLFDGLGKSITDLANNRLPMLQKGMEQVAQGVNASFKTIIESIGKDANANGIAKIFERTGQALNLMRPGIDALITGFIHLSEVGSRFLPRLANAFNTVMGKFERFIDRADADGSLERWIDRGLQTVTALGRAMLNLGSIFGSITEAYEKATGNVGGFASTIEGGLGRIAAKLKSPEGQRAMVEWIHTARDFIDKIKESLPGIGNIFQSIGDAARTFAENAFPIFAKIGDFMDRFAWLAQSALTIMMAWRTAMPVIQGVQKFTNLMRGGMEAYRQATNRATEAREALTKAEADGKQVAEDARKKRIADAEEARRIQAAEYQNFQNAQRKQTKAQMALQGEKTSASVDLATSKKRLENRKAELAIAEREEFLARQAKRSAQQNLGVVTNLAEPGQSPVGVQQRKQQLKATIKEQKTRVETLATELKSLKKGGIVDGIVDLDAPPGKPGRVAKARIKSLKAELAQELGTLEALLEASNGGLERSREIAWDQVRAAEEREGKATQRRIQLEEDVAKASRNTQQTRLQGLRNVQAAEAQYVNALEDTRAATRKSVDADRAVVEANQNLVNSWKSQQEPLKKNNSLKARLSSLMDQLKDKFPRLSAVIGSGKIGFVGKLGALAGAFATVATSIAGGAATIGLMVALDKLAEAHKKAGDRAEYQRGREEALANQLDATTGAVTEQGLNDAMRQGQNFQITGGANKTIDVNAIEAAQKAGVSKERLKESLNPVNVAANQEVQKTFDDQTLAAIRSGKDPQWNKWKDKLGEFGLSDVDYAKAVNGDQAAVDKFNSAIKSWANNNVDGYGLLTNTLAALPFVSREQAEKVAALDAPELGVAAENLNSAGVSSVAASQFQRSTERANSAAGTATKALGDKAVLKPSSPFGGAQDAFWGSDGQSVGLVLNGVDAKRKAELEALGVSLTPAGNAGRYVVSLSGDQVTQWVEPKAPGYARGGPVWGAGSATSDSIPAMLSNGEYVINAKSADAIGRSNLDKLNQGNSPRLVNGVGYFDGGGDTTNIIDVLKRQQPGSASSGTPGTGQRPGDFNRSEFQSAGQAQAARRGVGPVGDSAPSTNVLADVAGAIAGAQIIPPGAIQPSDRDISDYERRNGLPPAPLKGSSSGISDSSWNQYTQGLGISGSVGRSPAPTKPVVPNPVATKPVTPLTTVHTGSGQPGPEGQQSTPGYPTQLTPQSIGGFPRMTPPALASAAASSAAIDPGVSEMMRGNWASMSPAARSAAVARGEYALDGTPIAGGAAAPQPIVAGLGGIMANPGQSPRDFAHGTMMPFWQNQGFIVGDHQADNYGEHQNGAVDVMVSDIASGERVLQQVLSDPNVYGVIFNNKVYGYGQGSTPRDYTSGFTGNPTQDHIDHVHVWYKPGGSDNIVPRGSGGNQLPLTPAEFGTAGPIGALGSNGLPVIPNISAAEPPPGVVTGPGGGGKKKDGIPGLTAPIQGPFGEIPFNGMDILKQIGNALLSAFLGFFGINADPIISLINQIFGGVQDAADARNQGEGDPGVISEESPNPNIDPGPDPQYVAQLDQQAAAARAAGDTALADNLMKIKRDYIKSRNMSSAPASTLGTLTLDSAPADVAKAILSEARARGYSKEQAQAILATAIQESGGGLNPRAVTPGGNWREIFQNPKNPVFRGDNDPNANIGGFFDRLDAKSAAVSDIWQAIYWTQKRPDSASGADVMQMNPDPGYLPSIQNPSVLGAAKKYMETFGYARGGLVRRFNAGGMATSGPKLPGVPIDPEEWVANWEDSYGPFVPGYRSDGSIYAIDPMENANGGHIRGPGTATSDSIPALLSDGEYVMRAAAVKHWGVDRLNAMNGMKRFADGGYVDPLIPPITPPPPIAISGLPSMGAGNLPNAQPSPTGGTDAPPNPQSDPTDLSNVPGLGKSLGPEAAADMLAQGVGSLASAKGGGGGGSAQSGAPRSPDPRAILGTAPASDNHTNPALSAGIRGAFNTIGGLAATAASIGASAAAMGATGGTPVPGASQAGAIGGQFIQSGAQILGGIADGAVNIISSMLVGTATPSQTGQGYGAPLVPSAGPAPMNNYQSVHNGDIVTNNLTEYQRLKDRKDAQKAAPFFNRVNS